MNSKPKSIWIDLDNSPHVPLFVPIIEHYRTRGVEVIVTARDHAQTIELLDLAGLKGTYFVVGRHYGKGKIDKIRGLLARAKQLVSCIRNQNKQISLAVSHGSRSMVLAARWLKIPIVTMYDYEFTETRIFNIFSDRVLVPERIPESVLNEIGLPMYKRVRYPGIKEELYLVKFQPTPNFRETLFAKHDVSVEKSLAVLRPPATTANYHDARGDVLFTAIIERLLSSNEVFTLIVPRTREHEAEISETIAKRQGSAASYEILDEAINGLDLIYAADLVISGGGTMNREAVLLGVPVYSIFAGRQGALDKQMESEGLITFIRDVDDIAKIKLERRQPSVMNALTDRVEKSVIEQIDSYLT
ncbi:MAG: DUF354 domain-containing protein [Pyrinomonadaceae bacterium]